MPTLSTLCIMGKLNCSLTAVADPGGAKGAMAPPWPCKIGHKKDGCQRRPHRFHVSRPPLTRPLDPLLVSHRTPLLPDNLQCPCWLEYSTTVQHLSHVYLLVTLISLCSLSHVYLCYQQVILFIS